MPDTNKLDFQIIPHPLEALGEDDHETEENPVVFGFFR
jgi:hypothetical protein